MEVCGCSREAAARAVEAAGPGGADLAVELVLSTMSTHVSLGAFEAPPQPAKLVCLVRQGVGKVAAQVSHGALAAYRSALRSSESGSGDGAAGPFRVWQEGGEPTIVLSVKDMAQLDMLLAQAEARGLPTERVADAGRTEVAAGSVTVGTIGPANSSEIDLVTGDLSLL
jgi:PTH2 family peptidyl-tRNA hydrolase